MGTTSVQVTGNTISLERDRGFDDFCIAFRRREEMLTLVYQLNQMIKAVQKHRGMSVALLGGIAEFRDEFDNLQRELERRLATLETFARHTGGLLGDRDKENLHLAWATIRHNWQDDQVADNFELHSHFVEQLLGMVYGLAKQLEKPLCTALDAPPEVDGKSAYPRMFQLIEVLNFVARQLPEMIEHLARVRGLSTYAATLGAVDYPLDRKLRYLVQTSRQQSEKIRHQAERLDEVLDGALVSLRDMKNLELKLIFLLNTLDRDLLSGMTITANSQHLFRMATDILDIYWKVVNEGLSLVRRWHEEDLEFWNRARET